ncbi:hypothetical protein BJ994_001118 [Arthrobacter pigmenti]|uniref:Uncharacterized protein n=1 Tax=Arthrobacter pigmenti TaxID=271432 RepID=A0A846RN48_9MICC|nr:hypothetical protein [Arthrobacter pigmenti]
MRLNAVYILIPRTSAKGHRLEKIYDGQEVALSELHSFRLLELERMAGATIWTISQFGKAFYNWTQSYQLTRRVTSFGPPPVRRFRP